MCGSGAADDLDALNDPNAENDAHLCGALGKTCRNLPTDYNGGALTLKKNGKGVTLTGRTCTAPARPQVTAALVRQHVVRLVPSASIGLAPAGKTLVNIQTIMWVNTGSHRTLAPLTLLGRKVVVTLKLDHVAWDFDDGHRDSTSSPGKAYSSADPCHAKQCPGYYGHTYRHSGNRSVTARETWHASFTVDGGDAIDIPGTVTGPASRTRLTVDQARAVLVPNPGH